MDPLDQLQPPPPQLPTYKNRRPWLVGFGIIELVIALVFLAMGLIVLSVPPPAASTSAEMQRQTREGMVLLMIVYAGMTTVWATSGIGLMLAKNWARITSLVLTYAWITFGLLMTLGTAFFMPQALKGQPNVTKESIAVVVFFMIVFMLILMIAIPAVFLLFLHNKNVKATCLAERGEGATNRPVLINILIVLSAIALLFMPLSFVTSRPMIWFGTLISGAAKASVMIFVAALEACALWGYLKNDIRGWWAAVVPTSIWCLSVIVTLARGNLVSLYEKMAIDTNGAVPRNGILLTLIFVFALVFGLAKLGAILYAKRYFVSGLRSSELTS